MEWWSRGVAGDYNTLVIEEEPLENLRRRGEGKPSESENNKSIHQEHDDIEKPKDYNQKETRRRRKNRNEKIRGEERKRRKGRSNNIKPEI